MVYWRSYYKKHNTLLCTPASVIQAEIDTLETIFHYTQSLFITLNHLLHILYIYIYIHTHTHVIHTTTFDTFSKIMTFTHLVHLIYAYLFINFIFW